MNDERRTHVLIPVPLKRAALHQADQDMITLTDIVREGLMMRLSPATVEAMRAGEFDPSE